METNVTLSNVPDALDPLSNRTYEIQRLDGNENELVSFDIGVPADSPQGNYSVEAELKQGNRTLDSANYTVWVDDADSSDGDESSNTGNDDTNTESDEDESGGAVAVGMAEEDCGWTCIDDDLNNWWDEISFEWSLDWVFSLW